ncbi:cysteine-rich CWC family protein [Shewanella oncorhynchi]|uniref:cysteine-rich CWC family protein n=1 Tax=Shewanella TaxID=22 RepID=UPI0021D815EC|nr:MULTISPECIES: cysteine-rich CWC family protein [unclassified Shewanella]MCU8010070.1 cysteine-rich CWC family protein [Shewanella sp. SM87]MCU8057696.1 cysteine-rich CWC family protein [Shewanella sp. SM35]MCU8066526.1 cysteine-rich CWC family protein [Shewanella sp. SM34]MCU8075243.1 cysteine-rich CWC family protein [Shewanella sp. SM29]
MSKSLQDLSVTESQICPLCQGANQCAVIVGKGIEDCWCTKQVFPPLAVLQAQASDSLQGAISPILPSADACICQTCLSKLKQSLSQGLIATQDEKSPSSVSDGLGYEVK